MKENGVIKFDCVWSKSDLGHTDLFEKLNAWRRKLYELKLIGMYDNGIDYGNISVRFPHSNKFLISGSGTGAIEQLDKTHYSIVTGFDLEKNLLYCSGPAKASSESMTHAIIYKVDQSTNAVVHIHNMPLWGSLLNIIPSTSKDVEYGTPEMARETKRLLQQTDALQRRIFVMGGHEEGIVSFGKDLDEAGDTILQYFKKYVNDR